ncbi:MAG TPA: LD-carboxypeptidase [Gammaproteobacteria bacterium]|nr:LD-carboxypeptidase [Gammaproteobacteria bacterium]
MKLSQQNLTRRKLIQIAGGIAALASVKGLSQTGLARSAQISKPNRLSAGATIGLITPASNVPENEDLLAAMDLVRSLGFEAKAAPNLRRRKQYLAGSDKQRAEDLNGMFADQEVDAIFCVRGGYGSGRLLRELDYQTIASNPKILMGYSDITAILNAIHLKTGMITYHGPMAGDNFSSYTYDQFQRVLMEPRQVTLIGEPPPFVEKPGVVERKNRLTPIVSGQAEGRLIGGNLSLLVTLLGTPYEPDFDGAILFIEDVSEPPYSVDRMLTHLWLSGHLERTAGIVFGKFTDDNYDNNTLSMEQVLHERCEPLGIPTLRGAMIGHIEDQTVVPIGANAHLDVNAGTLTLLETAVS